MIRFSKMLRHRHKSRAGANRVSIYMYHGVTEAPLEFEDWCFIDSSSFHWQLKALREHFDIVSLIEAVERLRRRKIDRPTAVITLDDGFQNNYDVAYPIFQELGLPATIFVTTGFVDTDDTLWYCRLHRALAASTKKTLEWDGIFFDLLAPGAKARVSAEIQARLKRFPQSRLLEEVRCIVLMLGDDPDDSIPPESCYRMLSREAISVMARSGLIEFGAHTVSHAILSLLSTEERYNEIRPSVAAVQGLTGQPCRLFAYPNGLAQDYNEDSMKILEACKIQAAVTAIDGFNDPETPLMELRRLGVGADLSRDQFRYMLE